MSKFRMAAAAAVLIMAGALAPVTAATAAIAGVTSYTVTAKTAVSDRPDSGNAGYWADDTFTRTASVHLVAEAALSFCGGSTPTGHCYRWTGNVADKGTFKTIIGAKSPGAGSGGALPIGVSAAGPFNGSYGYSFYSSWKTASASRMPASENDAGNAPAGRSTTGAWVEQFFGPGARFYVNAAPSNELGTTGGWEYTLGFGADTACPHMASQWVDSSWPVRQPWGTAPYQGNILAPDTAHC